MSLLRITPRRNFFHAGNLPSWLWRDPRSEEFEPDTVLIDLGRCEFIWPSAVVWCATYGLLVRNRDRNCELIVPEDMGVATYLKSTGLFAILKEAGISVDDRGIGEASSSQTIVALSRFTTEFEAEQLANSALDRLTARESTGSSLAPVVSENFAELAFNAVQHSQSAIGGLGLIQFYNFRDGLRFAITVADGGIGIRRGLYDNPTLRDKIHYDWTAIELATRERISGTGDTTRGIGLYGVAEDARRGGRRLIVHSGIGVLEISEDVRQDSRRTNPYPGTLAFMSIPTQ